MIDQAARRRAMRRDATGQLVEKTGAKGVTFGLRFKLPDGRRAYTTLGRSWEGCDRRDAERRAATVLAQARLDQWRTREDRQLEQAEREVERATMPAFATEADRWLQWRKTVGGRRGNGLTSAGLADLTWRLAHLGAWFGGMLLDEIDEREIEQYVLAKRTAPLRDGGLSPASVAKTITVLRSVLDRACRHRIIDGNPAAGFKVPVPTPARTYLDTAAHIEALLAAAGARDGKGRLRVGHGRQLLATLVFAGLRIDEALSLRWRDVELGIGVLRVRRSKTEAGVREVDILPPLADELSELKARRNPGRDDLVFATSRGGKDSASNVRMRILAKAVEDANEKLIDDGHEPIPPGLTPHSLRRTYASLLFAIGTDLPTAMDQLGHVTERMTLGVYARTMRRRDGERERLHALVTGGDISVPSDADAAMHAELRAA